MLSIKKTKMTLLAVSLFSGSALFAQAKPSYQNVVTAKQKVTSVTQRVQRIIRNGGGGGGGGGNHCSRIQNYRMCIASECQWEGRGHIGRCVMPGRHHGEHRNRGPFGGFGENDTAALLAMQGMTIGLQNLSNDIDMATQTYYTPQFFYWKNQVCAKS